MGITIAGINHDEHLQRGTFSITNVQNAAPDNCSFNLKPGSPKPAIGSEVIYTDPDGNRLFGGVLSSAVELPRGEGYACSCSDWRARIDRKTLNDRFVSATAGQIIKELFNKYLPGEFDLSQVSEDGREIASIRFKRGTYITGALSKLAELTGFIWDIDPFKNVIWDQPGTLAAPFDLNDSSYNFADLTIEPNRDQLRNKVIVKGGLTPATVATVDRFTGDGLSLSFRLSKVPYGIDQYNVLDEGFNGGIDLDRWVKTDVVNPSPPAGHIPSDGYMFTTIQQGAALAESGFLQVVGGTGVHGEVRLQSYQTFERGDGGRRFEFDVYPNSIGTAMTIGLFDPSNPSVIAGTVYGFRFTTGNLIVPHENGVAQTALASVSYAINDQIRLRIIPKSAGGATYWVNKDAANGFRPSQWVKLYDSTYSTIPSFLVTPIFNQNAQCRIDRVRVYNRLYGLSVSAPSIFENFNYNNAALHTAAGSAGTWTWDTANSRLAGKATGAATNAVYLRNTVKYADVTIQFTTSQAVTAGVVFRYVDASNYYYLVVRDATTGGNVVELYKRVAGVNTSIGGIPTPTFPRGTEVRIRLVVKGSSIAVQINGASVGSVNDTTFTAAGQVGFIATQTTDTYFKSFAIMEEKVIGALNIDEDSGADALIGISTGVPVLSFFGDVVPAKEAPVEITYYDGIPVVIQAQDDVSIQAIKALEGNDGIYEGYIEDPSLDSRELARARGQQELEQFSNPVTTLTFRTTHAGLRANQLLFVTLTDALSKREVNGSFLINSVTITSKGSGNYEYTVTAGSKLKGIEDYIYEMLIKGKQEDPTEDDNSPIDELIWSKDEIVFTSNGSVSGPTVVNADSFYFEDLTVISEGPLPPYTYGKKSFIDTFNENSSVAYEAGGDSSTFPVVVFNTANSRLEISAPGAGGTQNTYVVKGVTYDDFTIEAEISRAADAGLVFRYKSGTSYYLLVINDDTHTLGNNLVLYKRAGSFTALPTANISFIRDTTHQVKLVGQGTSIKVYWDGVLVISTTDTSITGEGSVGIRSNSNAASYFGSFTASPLITGARYGQSTRM